MRDADGRREGRRFCSLKKRQMSPRKSLGTPGKCEMSSLEEQNACHSVALSPQNASVFTRKIARECLR